MALFSQEDALVALDMMPRHKHRASDYEPRVAYIIRVVCNEFNLTRSQILGDQRYRPIAFPRQIGMYLAALHSHLSLPAIGREFNRDPTTVLHAIKRVKDDWPEHYPDWHRKAMILEDIIASATNA